MNFLIGSCPTCCPEWGCGSNSAWLGENLVFHEIDASGVNANSAGLTFAGFFDAYDQPLDLQVQRDVLRGGCTVIDPSCPSIGLLLTESRLIGSKIKLRDRRDQQRTHWLTIVDYETTPYWVDPVWVEVPAYKFVYDSGSSRDDLPLCRRSAEEWEPIQGKALIFRGDRYDAASKTVVETGGGDTWFNIACAGTAIAKMHLMRHTWAASNSTHTSTPQQRQSLLKLLTADYCGTGKPFTVDGHDLLYSYLQPWVPKIPDDASSPAYWAGATSIDATWSAGQATCLDVPRLEDEIPGIRGSIVAQCSAASVNLPPCDPNLLGKVQTKAPGAPAPWLDYGLSANRF